MTRAWIPIVLLCAALLLAAALSLAVGPLPWSAVDRMVLELRALRLLAGVAAGASLAVAGVLMQGLFRNPLASPSVTGVTAGAGLGAMLTLMVVDGAAAAWLGWLPREFWLPFGGIAGALAALALLLALARRCGGERGGGELASVLLIGLMLSLLLSAIAGYVLALGANRFALGRALIAFSLGGLDGAATARVAMTLPLVGVGVVAAWAWGRPLDLLLSGETEAQALGVDVARVRRWTLVWTAVLSATAVVLGGGVPFVCLVVPNALRAWVGPAHRPLIVLAAIGGAAFLTLADVAARVLATGQGEIPLGVITALIGAPFFLWFFRRLARA